MQGHHSSDKSDNSFWKLIELPIATVSIVLMYFQQFFMVIIYMFIYVVYIARVINLSFIKQVMLYKTLPVETTFDTTIYTFVRSSVPLHDYIRLSY